MPSLREIKKHIKGVRSSGKLAEAMKSISAAKYYRVSAAKSAFEPYARQSAKIAGFLRGAQGTREENPGIKKKCFVVITGNRGLCGGYNTNLLNYFEEIYKAEPQAFVVVCGKRGGEYFDAKGIKITKRFVFKDIPQYAESETLCDYLNTLYESEAADEIIAVYQKHKNILTQTPGAETLLPEKAGGTEEDVIGEFVFYPDKQTAAKAVYSLCFKNKVHYMLLESAAGAQAATMMAMRTAADNASKLKTDLEIQLQRKRQGQITSGVIETSGANENATSLF